MSPRISDYIYGLIKCHVRQDNISDTLLFFLIVEIYEVASDNFMMADRPVNR